MSDSESDGEEAQKMEHVTGPVEDAWKMKIPEFKPEDNKNGLLFFVFVYNMLSDLFFRSSRRVFFCYSVS